MHQTLSRFRLAGLPYRTRHIEPYRAIDYPVVVSKSEMTLFWSMARFSLTERKGATLDWSTYAQTILKGCGMRQKIKCGAYARSTGSPCQAKALSNGRCKNHGGMSTGPKTPEGRQAIAEATRQRMAFGGRMLALEGFYRWLEVGGRETLSRLAKNRERRKRWERLMVNKF